MAPFKEAGKPTRHPGIKKLPDGTFLVRRTWIYPKTGRRRHRRKIVRGSVEDAQRVRADLRAQETRGAGPLRPRFKPFAESWLGRHKTKIEDSTLERYTADVANLGMEFGDWWVDALDYDAVEKWQADM